MLDSLTRAWKGEESVTTQKDESSNIHHVVSIQAKSNETLLLHFTTV